MFRHRQLFTNYFSVNAEMREARKLGDYDSLRYKLGKAGRIKGDITSALMENRLRKYTIDGHRFRLDPGITISCRLREFFQTPRALCIAQRRVRSQILGWVVIDKS